jgi:uncharacterized damage-inducible protein DinB
MMIIPLIRTLYQYNAWANERILTTAMQLSPDQLHARGGASFGSVHETLVHIMSAQWVWLARWKGTSPSSMLEAQSFPELTSIQSRWVDIEQQTQQFVTAVDEAQLALVVEYVNLQGEHWAYPLWQQMVHQVNHATQHRSEVAVMLTEYGHSPGWLDFLYFVDELK